MLNNKKIKSSIYMRLEASVTYVQISKKSLKHGALIHGGYCDECQLDLQAFQSCGCDKAAVYELLRTWIVDGPVL